MEVKQVKDGKVILIAGGGKIYTDIAARFCKSEKDINFIIDKPYNSDIVKRIISSGHEAMLEFDHFIFAVEGYSRVCETQLVRKRLASYAFKSNREDKNGKRNFSMVIPGNIQSLTTKDGKYNYKDILNLIEDWYNNGVESGVPEEDLRYMKPQATEFKGLISMNAHALRDWFKIRMCQRAQFEIRDLAYKMHKLCIDVAPDLFKDSGPNCKVYGYCPENDFQCDTYKNLIATKAKALQILSDCGWSNEY